MPRREEDKRDGGEGGKQQAGHKAHVVIERHPAHHGVVASRLDATCQGFELSEQERADVIAFLESMTDQEFLENPELTDPWTQ